MELEIWTFGTNKVLMFRAVIGSIWEQGKSSGVDEFKSL